MDLRLHSDGRVNAVASRAALPEVVKITRRVLNRAKVLAPVRTGRLRASGKMDVKITHIGPSGSITFTMSYAKFVHEGTKAHVIRAKKKNGRLKFKGAGGGFVYRRQVLHPGTRARPFLERALREIAPASGFEVHS